MPKQASVRIQTLSDLAKTVAGEKGFDAVQAALQNGQSAAIDGAWGSSCAMSAAALANACPDVFLVIVPRIAEVDDFALDLAGFSEETPVVFPAWETLPEEHDVSDAIFGGRLRVLGDLHSEQPPKLVVAALPALLQPVPSQQTIEQSSFTIRVDDEIEPETLLRELVDRGFERVHTIEVPGEFTMHGGILDIFPPDAVDPIRIEFFGDTVDSMRSFDVETQRKVEDLSQITLTLVSPVHLEDSRDAEVASSTSKPEKSGESLLDSLPENSWIAFVDLAGMIAEGHNYLARLDDPRGLYSIDTTLAQCTGFPSVTISAIAADSMEVSCHLRMESLERLSNVGTKALSELADILVPDETVILACHNEGEQQRLQELIVSDEPRLENRVQLCLGHVMRGFRMVEQKLLVISDHELFQRTDLRRGKRLRKRTDSRAIDSFLELNENDLVVHLSHGIGRYKGMKLLEKEDQAEEHLVVEFRDGLLIYVPVSLIHLVQKYIGAAGTAPRLSRLGGTGWSKKKEKVADAVKDMASEMLRLQAAREAQPGISYPSDSHWQQEFEATFSYTETPDQLDAIIDIKQDMQKSRPMDRLICGDVGYGKTEVAIRAAFKAIEAGRQVGVLVPTTVLAEQHFRTFTERMAEFPFQIEVLSRFRTKGEQRDILNRLEQGQVDLVIGTHRLVQKDVLFKDLGLLIIDEEQRFGVDAKDMLKRMRLEVDVLTLSATPIPRTLHLSLLGIRDISNLLTPPQDRLAIETRIVRFDPELIRHAIVREMNRGGQVYFVHNRVYNIQPIADRIQTIVPEASIGIGHGQMKPDELERAMVDFVSGKTDILVCTTIIESGLDIPNANTIFIHDAGNYGLADMHQLRGRVGRYRHRAYCYLLLEEGKPITTTAAKRLKAIEEYSELGAGFKIAMRDLEIRGAGNILGTEQSGHISVVGYELYCQLLENAVRRMKRMPLREHKHVNIDLPITAYLPGSYVPPGRQKIEVYRRISSILTLQQLDELHNELRDRFGPVPDVTERLLELKRLQVYAQFWQIDEIRLEERFAVFGYRNESKVKALADQVGSDLRIVDGKSAYLLLQERDKTDDALIQLLQDILVVEEPSVAEVG